MRPRLFLYWGGSMAACFMIPVVAAEHGAHGLLVALPVLALATTAALASVQLFRAVVPVPEPLSWAAYDQMLADAGDLLAKLEGVDVSTCPGAARIAHERALGLAAGKPRRSASRHELVRGALAHLQAAARLSAIQPHAAGTANEARLWPWDGPVPDLPASDHLVRAGALIAAALDREALSASGQPATVHIHDTTTILRPRAA